MKRIEYKSQWASGELKGQFLLDPYSHEPYLSKRVILENELEESEFTERIRRRLSDSARDNKTGITAEGIEWSVNYAINGNGKDIRGYARIGQSGERIFEIDAEYFDELMKQYPQL